MQYYLYVFLPRAAEYPSVNRTPLPYIIYLIDLNGKNSIIYIINYVLRIYTVACMFYESETIYRLMCNLFNLNHCTIPSQPDRIGTRVSLWSLFDIVLVIMYKRSYTNDTTPIMYYHEIMYLFEDCDFVTASLSSIP